MLKMDHGDILYHIYHDIFLNTENQHMHMQRLLWLFEDMDMVVPLKDQSPYMVLKRRGLGW